MYGKTSAMFECTNNHQTTHSYKYMVLFSRSTTLRRRVKSNDSKIESAIRVVSLNVDEFQLD